MEEEGFSPYDDLPVHRRDDDRSNSVQVDLPEVQVSRTEGEESRARRFVRSFVRGVGSSARRRNRSVCEDQDYTIMFTKIGSDQSYQFKFKYYKIDMFLTT